MKKQFKLGVIGCGVMGKAILKGAVLSEFLRAKKVIASDLDTDILDGLNEELNVSVTDDNRYLVENSEFVLFAAKPQDFAAIAEEISGICPEKVISVMAGVKKADIKNSLGVGIIRVARCVPNLPCTVGSGITAVDMSDYNKSTDDSEFIYNLFSCMGQVVSVPENKLDAVTAISGSGPAYAFMLIDSLVDAGVKHGLSKDLAQTLAAATVMGSAELVQSSESSIPDLIMSACSKGGTTIEAVKALEEHDFRKAVEAAVDACVKRSEELSKK